MWPVAGPSTLPPRHQRRGPFSFFCLLVAAPAVLAEVTVYNGASSITTSTSLAPGAAYTGLAAFDPTLLTPPTPPSPPVTSGNVYLPSPPSSNLSLSIPQRGNFLGFSIELSIADVIMGKSGTRLMPEFLNYLGNIQSRAGQGPVVRVGGNTQEGSTIFVDGLPGGTTLSKIKNITIDGDDTDLSSPLINYSPGLLYTMSNISALVGTEWFFGLAFNQTDVSNPTGNIPLAAQWAQKVLGPNLRGLGLGNEPDLYSAHNARPGDYNVAAYVTEFADIAKSVVAGGQLSNQLALVGPSLCCQIPGFELGDVINNGYFNDSSNLGAVTVQHYPANNCHVTGNFINPQDIFYQFLNHTNAESLVALYLSDSAAVQAAGKEFVMLEMNTASCGGFAGLSDSFGAAMWMTDYALQMAWGNFSAALMHVGGQNVYYNPFTPPPGNMTSTEQWTTGAVYYSSLVVAEVFGKSNNSRIVDLSASTDIYHPVYAIYESDIPTRAVLFNYVSDPSGASTYDVTLNSNSSSVSVHYLSAPTVSEQSNITWANQTMGFAFRSDGRLTGTLNTVNITCTGGQCVVPVYAPSIALVFLTPQALDNSSVAATAATSTFATTVIGTGTLDPAVLQTSNGQDGPVNAVGSTSEGSTNAAQRRLGDVWSALLLGGVVGMGLVRTLC